MRLDFESNIVSLPLTESGTSENHSVIAGQTKELLREGVNAAQAGNRTTARILLTRVTELDPRNENAWLWLASISEYPEELLVFLNNVLDINPHNERALEWTAATKTLLAKTFVQRGIDASKDNQMETARQFFRQALGQDENSEMAWLWLASIADSPEEKKAHLDKLVSINPENHAAQTALKSLQTQASQKLLQKANQEAALGNRESAAAHLAEVLENSPELADAWLLKAHLTDSFDEKINCFEQVLAIDPAHETAQATLLSLRSLIRFTAPKPAVEPVAETNQPAAEDNSQAVETQDSNEVSAAETALSDHPTQELEMPAALFTAEHSQDRDAEAMPPANDDETVGELPTAWFDDEAEIPHAADENRDDRQHSEAELPAENAVFENSDKSLAAHHEFENAAVSDDENVEEVFADASFETTDAAKNPARFADTETGETAGNFVYLDVSKIETAAPEAVLNDDDRPEEKFRADSNDNFQPESAAENHAETALSDDYLTNAAPDERAADHAPEAFFEADADNFDAQEISVQPAAMPVEAEIHVSKPAETFECPFCGLPNEVQALNCGLCRATLSLSDLETLLGNHEADQTRLQQAVSRMELEKNMRGYNSEELVYLGIGQINLKNLRQGFACLQEAAQMQPNDLMLASQVNALAIRLAEIEQKEDAENGKPKGKTILVIDDSATVRKLISGKLEKSGHEVVCAVDGMDALAKLNEIVPDLILLDITMPRMDGYQVCKLIRNTEATKNIPVVMISGKDGFFDKVRGRMAGTSGYITKPFGPETLMKALEVYITDKEAAAL